MVALRGIGFQPVILDFAIMTGWKPISRPEAPGNREGQHIHE
jgi:hypothetical protein